MPSAEVIFIVHWVALGLLYHSLTGVKQVHQPVLADVFPAKETTIFQSRNMPVWRDFSYSQQPISLISEPITTAGESNQKPR